MMRNKSREIKQVWPKRKYAAVLAAAAAKSLQSCPTLCDPIEMAAHQAPPSLRFSRLCLVMSKSLRPHRL